MSLPDLSSTPRTALGRHHERGQTDRDDLYAVLDAGLICHLGVIVNGAPRVLPTGYGRLGDVLYLHGSSANSSIMAGNGQEICVTVTHLARLVTDPAEQLLALRTITEHLVPGQWSYARQPSRKELAATSALALPLAEASVKIRAGGPSDEPEDYTLDMWAGVVPVTTEFREPEPDSALRPGIDPPPHIVKRGGLAPPPS